MLSDRVSSKSILWLEKKYGRDSRHCPAKVLIETNIGEGKLLGGERDLLITEITDTFPQARQEEIVVKRTKKDRGISPSGGKAWSICWNVPEPGLVIRNYDGWRNLEPVDIHGISTET